MDLLRGPVLKSGVPTSRIVPEFDVPHNVAARVLAGRIPGAVDALVLQRGEERLGHRIVVTDPGAADGLPENTLLQRLSELPGRVVAAAVGMENSILSERVITGGHLDRLLDERRLVVIVRPPADHFLRIAVDTRRQVKPALPHRNAGDAADHFLARRASGEIPLHKVGNVMLPAVALGQAEPPRPRLAGPRPQPAHHGPPRPGPPTPAPGHQARVAPPVPARPVRIIE